MIFKQYKLLLKMYNTTKIPNNIAANFLFQLNNIVDIVNPDIDFYSWQGSPLPDEDVKTAIDLFKRMMRKPLAITYKGNTTIYDVSTTPYILHDYISRSIVVPDTIIGGLIIPSLPARYPLKEVAAQITEQVSEAAIQDLSDFINSKIGRSHVRINPFGLRNEWVSHFHNIGTREALEVALEYMEASYLRDGCLVGYLLDNDRIEDNSRLLRTWHEWLHTKVPSSYIKG